MTWQKEEQIKVASVDAQKLLVISSNEIRLFRVQGLAEFQKDRRIIVRLSRKRLYSGLCKKQYTIEW